MAPEKKLERITQILMSHALDGNYTEKETLVEISKVISAKEGYVVDAETQKLLDVKIPDKLFTTQEYYELRNHRLILVALSKSANYIIYAGVVNKIAQIDSLMSGWEQKNKAWKEKYAHD